MKLRKLALACAAIPAALFLTGCGSSDDRDLAPVNSAPIINVQESVTVNEAETLVVIATVSDPDNDSVTIEWSQISGPQLVMNNADSDSVELVLPSVTNDTEAVIQIMATDENNLQSSQQVVVTITNVNSIPVAIAGNDQEAELDNEVILDGSNSYDDDGQITAWHWEISDPNGNAVVLEINSDAVTRFTPQSIGEYRVTLSVTDNDNATSSDEKSIIVHAPNLAPVADAGGDQSVVLGNGATVKGSESYDPEGEQLTYLWSLIPPNDSEVELAEPNNVSTTFTPDVVGAYLLTLTVTDESGLTDTDSVVITVDNENLSPIAVISGNTEVTVGSSVSLSAVNSYDPENQTLQYHWAVNGPDSDELVLADNTLQTISFNADYEGIYVISLSVNDGELTSSLATLYVTAVTENIAPVAMAGEDFSSQPNTEIQLDGSGSYDDDGDTLSYNWTFVSVPEGAEPFIYDSTSALAYFTASIEGSYVVALTVSDSFASTTDNILITVVEESITIRLPYYPYSEEPERVAYYNYSWPSYEKSQYWMDVPEGSDYVETEPHQIVAVGRDYVIHVSAADTTGTIEPFFNGIYDGQVIHAGEVVEFTYGFPKTAGEQVDLDFHIEVEGMTDYIWHLDWDVKTN